MGLLVLTACLAGCGGQPYVSPERLDEGLVIVLPGIEGRGLLNEAICRGLDRSTPGYAIELDDWTSSLGPLFNLRAERRNRNRAEEIADRIVRYRMQRPGRPVYLVGHSGGAGMAVWIAESLPGDHKVTGLVLLQASLSPRYHLGRALEKTDQGIVSFFSSGDWVLLGLGTQIYGTMDGKHTSSAGRVGFRYPVAGRKPPQYDKLYQIAWREEMSQAGHWGGHLSVATSDFVDRYVGPLMALHYWSKASIARVQFGGGMGFSDPELSLRVGTAKPRNGSEPDASSTTQPAGE